MYYKPICFYDLLIIFLCLILITSDFQLIESHFCFACQFSDDQIDRHINQKRGLLFFCAVYGSMTRVPVT